MRWSMPNLACIARKVPSSRPSLVVLRFASSKQAKDASQPNSTATASDDIDTSPVLLPKKRRGRPPKPTQLDLDLAAALPARTHTSLATFLAHARTTSLSTQSTVYCGTLYEYITLLALSRYGFALHRTGRAGDMGIDLLGSWTLPARAASSTPLRVLVQCKAEAPQPRHIRELEGAVRGAPAGWRGEGIVALLVARGGATKGVREAVRRSGGAVGYMFVELEAGTEEGPPRAAEGWGEVDVEAWGARAGRVKQFFWNGTAAERGLEGLGVATRYDGEGGEEVGLTVDGKLIGT